MAQAIHRTPLYDAHVSAGARMVPFAGWEMPVQYAGILAEARAVRSRAGLFDVSHMGRLYISGADAPALLDWVQTSRASDLRLGRARYGLICNEEGGIVDDVVFFRLAQDRYLLVCNAGNREEVVPWLEDWRRDRFPGTSIQDRTETTAMIAFQGPSAAKTMDSLSPVRPSDLRYFSITEGEGLMDGRTGVISRTGYTGEDGFEIVVDAGDAPGLWETLRAQGGELCGLGARDVLRLEGGLPLHGHDIGPSTTPLEAGLERFVRTGGGFVGAEALDRQRDAGTEKRLVGLVLGSRSIAREGYPITAQGVPAGTVTSGTLSPTLDKSIAMGYVVMRFAAPGEAVQVDIRGRATPAEVVALPFYSRRSGG